MEEYQESVVEASVDAEQYETSEVSTSETDVNTEVVAPTSEEPKFGEALKAELARREAQLEKKYKEQYGDYDSIKSQNGYLEKRARQEGFDDVQAYLKAIDEYEQQQQIQAEASKYGVPEDFIRAELQPLKSELEQLRQEREKYQQNEVVRQVESEIASLSQKYEDFAGMKDDVLDFAMQNNIRLEHAYKLMTYESKIEQAALKKEQETLARVTGRDQKQVLPSKDSPNNVQFDPANMSFDEIGDISRRVQAGERITF